MKRTTSLLVLIWVLVIVWPAWSVWIGDFIISTLKSRPYQFHQELNPRIARTVITAIPFFILAVVAQWKLRKGDRFVIAGISGATLLLSFASCFLWVLFLFTVLGARWTGANIGIGILMLFSPLYLTPLIPAGYAIGKSRKKRKLAGTSSSVE
jgi:hypothetical protein